LSQVEYKPKTTSRNIQLRLDELGLLQRTWLCEGVCFRTTELIASERSGD